MICQLCGKEFRIHEIIDGKKRNLSKRKYCTECSPFNSHNTTKRLSPMKENKKYCPYCKKEKPFSDFYIRASGKYSGYCIECMQKESVTRFRKNKLEAVAYKGGKCEICGYEKCVDALEFHHLSPDEKDPNFKRMRGWKKERREKELDKCILVCSNCHREIHSGMNKIGASSNWQ